MTKLMLLLYTYLICFSCLGKEQYVLNFSQTKSIEYGEYDKTLNEYVTKVGTFNFGVFNYNDTTCIIGILDKNNNDFFGDYYKDVLYILPPVIDKKIGITDELFFASRFKKKLFFRLNNSFFKLKKCKKGGLSITISKSNKYDIEVSDRIFLNSPVYTKMDTTNPIFLKDYVKNSDTTVLAYWSIYCAPCVKKIEKFNSIMEKHSSVNTLVLLNKNEFKRYNEVIKEDEMSWTNYFMSNEYFDLNKPNFSPYFVAIDSKGMILDFNFLELLGDEYY